MDLKLRKDIARKTKHPPFPFWGFSLGMVSIIYAVFNLYHDGLLMGLMPIRLTALHEDLISWPLLGFGLMKVLGILLNHPALRRVGIVGLTGLWSMLLVFSIVYSFGIGYPTTRFITAGYIVVACLRVSLKGDFD